jgi:hypothetical protein
VSKQAHLPDGTILDFPDDTPDAVMDSVVKQHLQKAPAANTPPVAAPAANNSSLAQLISGAPHPDKLAQAKSVLRQYPGLGEVADYYDAFQHHAMGTLHGGAQLVEHGVNALTGGAIQDTVNQDDAALRQREADYQARTPDSVGAYGGAAVGEIAPWMTGVGELRALGLLPKFSEATTVGAKVANVAGKAALLSAQGAAMGATAPVTGTGPYADQKAAQVATGAIAAPLTAGALKGAGAATRLLGAGARYLTPAGREVIANSRLVKMLGTDPATEAALRVPSTVPGVAHSVDQVLGGADAVQAGRVLRNNGQTAPAFANQDAANNAAMRAHVEQVAKTDAEVQAAKAVRSAATDPWRAANLPETGSKLIDPAPVIGVLKRLSLDGSSKTVSSAAREQLALLQQHMKANGGKIPAYDLENIAQGSRSFLRGIAQNGVVTPKEVVKYEPVKTAITDAVERTVPGYRSYLAAYARHSQPINDMRAGRALIDAISSGGRDVNGNQIITLNKVESFLRKNKRGEFPMSPSAAKQIENVLEALKRRTVSHNTMAAAGPGTAADAQRALQASPLLMRMLGHTAAAFLGGTGNVPGMIAASAATEGANKLNNLVVQRVGAKAANAQLAADAIAANRLRLAKPRNGLGRLALPYDQQ